MKENNKMEFMDYIIGDALILIPALYILGMVVKNIQAIPDKFIPLILLPFGVVGAGLLMGFSASSVIQGILVTGAAVYANQLVKQTTKKE